MVRTFIHLLVFVCFIILSLIGPTNQNSNVGGMSYPVPAGRRAVQAPATTSFLYLPMVMKSVLIFDDEFDNDLSKWIIEKGKPTIASGKLILTDAAIRSKAMFTYGKLEMKIESSAWKPQNNIPFTDATFGFEYWYDTCHSGATFKANGHLAVLKESPCPFQESYSPLSGWDNVMPAAAQTLFVTITWLPTGTSLWVSNGNSYTATVKDALTPTVPLSVRLNSTWDEPHAAETYVIDYIRVYQDP